MVPNLKYLNVPKHPVHDIYIALIKIAIICILKSLKNVSHLLIYLLLTWNRYALEMWIFWLVSLVVLRIKTVLSYNLLSDTIGGHSDTGRFSGSIVYLSRSQSNTENVFVITIFILKQGYVKFNLKIFRNWIIPS